MRFEPLPPDYMIHGFKYSPNDAETCNAENYTCPRCGACDRDRLYALYLHEYFRELKSSDNKQAVTRILEFAPTPQLSGFIKKLIAKSPRSFSHRTADLFMDDVDDTVDITDMKIYDRESVDFFVCSHVLEHVTDDNKALAELYRILKRGGRGILVVPIVLSAREIDEDPSLIDPEERWRRFGQDDHVRLYSKEGFLTRVKNAGFTVSELNWEHFGRRTFRRYGIKDRSVLYIVEKHE